MIATLVACIAAPWVFQLQPEITSSRAERVATGRLPAIMGLDEAPAWDLSAYNLTELGDRMVVSESHNLLALVGFSVSGLTVIAAREHRSPDLGIVLMAAGSAENDLIAAENLDSWTADVLGRIHGADDWVVVERSLDPSGIQAHPDGTLKRIVGVARWILERRPNGQLCHEEASTWARFELDPYDGSLLDYRLMAKITYGPGEATLSPAKALEAAGAYAVRMGRQPPADVRTEDILQGYALHPDEYLRRRIAWDESQTYDDWESDYLARLREEGKELSRDEAEKLQSEGSQRHAAAIWPWPTAEAVLAYWFTADDLTIFVDARDGTAWHHMEPDGSTFIPEEPEPRMPPRADP